MSRRLTDNYTLIEGEDFLKNFEFSEELGRSNATVLEVKRKSDNFRAAVKEVYLQNESDKEKVKKEIKILQKIQESDYRHSFIGFYSYCIVLEKIDQFNSLITAYILMEKAEISLSKLIEQRKEKNQFFSENEMLILMNHLINAFTFLQIELSISHGDIKPENILFISQNSLHTRVCDVGCGEILDRDTKTKTIVGSIPFLAPELLSELYLRKSCNSYKADVFSLGLCFIYIISFQKFNKIERQSLNEDVLKEILDEWIKDCIDIFKKEEIGEILKSMLEIDPKKRFDFKQLQECLKDKKFEFFTKFDDSFNFEESPLKFHKFSETNVDDKINIKRKKTIGFNIKTNQSMHLNSQNFQNSKILQDILKETSSSIHTNRSTKNKSISPIKNMKIGSITTKSIIKLPTKFEPLDKKKLNSDEESSESKSPSPILQKNKVPNKSFTIQLKETEKNEIKLPQINNNFTKSNFLKNNQKKLEPQKYVNNINEFKEGLLHNRINKNSELKLIETASDPKSLMKIIDNFSDVQLKKPINFEIITKSNTKQINQNLFSMAKHNSVGHVKINVSNFENVDSKSSNLQSDNNYKLKSYSVEKKINYNPNSINDINNNENEKFTFNNNLKREFIVTNGIHLANLIDKDKDIKFFSIVIILKENISQSEKNNIFRNLIKIRKVKFLSIKLVFNKELLDDLINSLDKLNDLKSLYITFYKTKKNDFINDNNIELFEKLNKSLFSLSKLQVFYLNLENITMPQGFINSFNKLNENLNTLILNLRNSRCKVGVFEEIIQNLNNNDNLKKITLFIDKNNLDEDIFLNSSFQNTFKNLTDIYLNFNENKINLMEKQPQFNWPLSLENILLNFEGNSIGFILPNLINSLIKCKNLKFVNLNFEKTLIDSKSLNIFKNEFLNLKLLERVILNFKDNYDLDDIIVRDLGKIINLVNLKFFDLNLVNVNINALGIEKIFSAADDSRLDYMNLSISRKFTKDFIEKIALKKMSSKQFSFYCDTNDLRELKIFIRFETYTAKNFIKKEREEDCPFLKYFNSLNFTHYFICLTCFKKRNLIGKDYFVCSYCADECHKSHDLYYYGEKLGICSCYFTGICRCVIENICTNYMFNNEKNKIYQISYLCKTCEDKEICFKCKYTCHKDHFVNDNNFREFYCGCEFD